MVHWNDYFPPLNLWNYSQFHNWVDEFKDEETLLVGQTRFRQGEIVEKATQ
jgi:hypothetical protein